jgi:VTC domain
MISFAEGEVTKLRREFKLVLSPEDAQVLSERLSLELGGRLPAPTRITSVYFDRPGQPLTMRALRTPHDCLKVRTKEYSPDLGAYGVHRVVLEVKRERNGVTQKRRVWVPRSELRNVMHGRVGLLPLIAGGSLSPTLAVTYRRTVYQSSDSWRVTVDRDISYHRITPELALSEHMLCAERLPAPVTRDPRVVLEVKHLGRSLPEWVRELGQRSAEGYSKFAVGMAQLHACAMGSSVGG